MRALKVMFVCMCLVGITQLVWNQDHGVDAGRGTRGRVILGYLDPRTGTFTTKAQSFGAFSARHLFSRSLPQTFPQAQRSLAMPRSPHLVPTASIMRVLLDSQRSEGTP
jgi:hypothetical protein